MNRMEPSNYGPFMEPLLRVDRRRSLGPGEAQDLPSCLLESGVVDKAFAHAQVSDDEMARACLSGIWLLYDSLERSHDLCQAIETPTGSYWHGIMHRREGDFSNAKYWFRRVGDHGVYSLLATAIQSHWGDSQPPANNHFPLLSQGRWDPFAMVDACEACRSGSTDSINSDFIRDVQQWEWELLFDHSYRHAIDPSPSGR